MNSRNNIHCAICDSTDLANLGKIGICDYSVTSDTQSCACASDIYLCQNCSLLQKIYIKDELSIILKRYAEYKPHHLSGGREQLVFPANRLPLSRSAYALQQIKPLITSSTGKLLDFGTGNGALLKSASAFFSDWTFDAYDIKNSLDNEALSLSQLNRFYTDNTESLPTKYYDLITLWHVLEHISKPIDILQRLKQCLTVNGCILLQVPDIVRNPFDLAVIDHTLHFNSNTLYDTIRTAGFEVIADGESWFHNCLTLLIKPAIGQTHQLSKPQRESAQNYVDWIKKTCKYFEQIAYKGHYAIFGTGMASIWISSQLPGKATCFIDEDIAKLGKLFKGIPIVGPDKIPADVNIMLPFIPEMGEQIIHKIELYCKGKNIHFYPASAKYSNN